MARTLTSVYVEVTPSTDRFAEEFRRQLGPGSPAARSAQATVERLSKQLSKARTAEADAAGQVRVAEQRLTEFRNSGKAKASQVTAAEEALARARRKQSDAVRTSIVTARQLQEAQHDAARSAALLAKAEGQAADATGKVARESTRAAVAVKSLSVSGRSTSKVFSGLSTGVGVTVSGIAGMTRALGLAGGALALAGGSAALFGLKTASNVQQAQIAFTTMLGSAQKARTFLGQLQKFAAATPFEFPDLVRSSQRLIAMGIAAKDVIPYLTAIGDAVAGLGGGKEQIDQVTTAIGQMAAKGKIQSDELLQLTEAGIPALKILADSYHVSAGRMQEMVTKGKILSQDALPRLIEGLEKGTKSTAGFGGMMSKQSRTVAGLWSTLKDTVSTALANMITPFIPSITAGLQKLVEWSAKGGAGLTKFFAAISHGFRDTRAAAKELDAGLSGIGGGLSGLNESLKPIGGLFAGIKAGGEGAAQALRPIGKLFNDTTVPMGQFLGAIRPMGGLLKATGKDAETSGLATFGYVVGTGLAKLVLWVDKNKESIKAFGSALVTAGQAIGVAAGWVKNVAVPALADFWGWLQQKVTPVLQTVGKVISAVVVPAFRFLAKSISDNKPVITALVQLAKVLGVVIGGSLVVTLGLAVAAITAVSVAAGLLIRWWGLLITAAQKVAGAMRTLGQVCASVWGAIKAVTKSAIAEVVRTFFGMVSAIITGAAHAFGWVPGIGPKLKVAAAQFNTFKDQVNTSLAGVKSRNVVITAKVLASAATPSGSGGGAGRVRPQAHGGILKAFAGGTERHVAQIAQPGEMRLWAEPETGGEAYIPLAQSKRSRSTSILSAVAGRFGYGLSPMADGGLKINARAEGLDKFAKAMEAFNQRLTNMAITLGRQVAANMAGGPVSPGLNGALNFARSQQGKPYIWGGVGPAGYDCSGFMSALVNVAQGRRPYSRRFATGSLPAGLFDPGLNGAFQIGWFTGNPGHTAGTINGVNVESRGGEGVVVGARARGARSGLFSRHGHLHGFADGGILPGDPPFDILSDRGRHTRDGLLDFLKAIQVGPKSFDRGGWLPPHSTTLARNGTSEWEPVGKAGLSIGEVHVHDGVDLDLLVSRLGFAERAGSFT